MTTDFFFKWTDEADAKQDALMLADYLNVSPGDLREWARDRVLPNVKAWRVSQDVTTGSGTLEDPYVTTHQYLSGWFAIVSVNGQPSVLMNATALAFALDRNGPPYVVKNNIGGIITDVGCEPIFAGSHYPLGGYS